MSGPQGEHVSSSPPEAAIDFEASGSCPDKFLRLDGHVTNASARSNWVSSGEWHR